MKKTLLFALIAATAVTAMAENRAYTYTTTDTDGTVYPVLGSLRRVSPNGQWAAGGDDMLEEGSFIINTENPRRLISVPEGHLLSIDNNGMGVGAAYITEGYANYAHAAIYRDGEWVRLSEPETLIGRSYAVAISRDSKRIAGHAMCEASDSELGAKYFPVVWALNEDTGEYEIEKTYNDLELPANQGFFVYDMSPNGEVICGMLFTNFGGTVPAMINKGELVLWDTFEVKKDWEFTYKDEVYYKDAYFVDGLLETSAEQFIGYLAYATDSYAFGCRTIVKEVSDDGREGEVEHVACVYDIETQEFVDVPADYAYVCGVSPEEAFTTAGKYFYEGRQLAIDVAFQVRTDNAIGGIYSFDDSGKILTGETQFLHSALGIYVASPLLIICEEGGVTSGISSVSAESNAEVYVTGRTIEVSGAKSACIYSISGALAATGLSATVAPGVYVVVADGASFKVVVK